MRKVTQQTVTAFMQGQKCTIGNTRTDGLSLYLHGNEIARRINGRVEITSAGWETVTTKERLNGIPGVHVQQKNHQWYLNGQKWDGEWTLV